MEKLIYHSHRIWWHICIFSTAPTNAKKSKRATKPSHQDSSKQWTDKQRQSEHQLVTAPTKNWRFGG